MPNLFETRTSIPLPPELYLDSEQPFRGADISELWRSILLSSTMHKLGQGVTSTEDFHGFQSKNVYPLAAKILVDSCRVVYIPSSEVQPGNLQINGETHSAPGVELRADRGIIIIQRAVTDYSYHITGALSADGPLSQIDMVFNQPE